MNIIGRLYQLATLLACWMTLCAGQLSFASEIDDANRLFKDGKHNQQALDKVNGFLANNPKDAEARFLKGLIFTEQGRTSDAIKIYSALTEDYPELPEPYNNLAVIYASQGQYDKAKLALEMAMRTHPSYAIAYENLGDIYAKMASQAYDRALQLDHSNGSTQTKLAMINNLYRDGSRDEVSPVAEQGNPELENNQTSEPIAKQENRPDPAPSMQAAMITIEPAQVAPPLALPDQNKEVLETVDAWAAAWSSRDVENYLSHYASDFNTPNNQSRAAWEATRRERITRPKSIQVDISNTKIKFSDNAHATVSFRQSYRAPHFKASGNKILVMVKSDGKWLIQEERAR